MIPILGEVVTPTAIIIVIIIKQYKVLQHLVTNVYYKIKIDTQSTYKLNLTLNLVPCKPNLVLI